MSNRRITMPNKAEKDVMISVKVSTKALLDDIKDILKSELNDGHRVTNNQAVLAAIDEYYKERA